MYLFLKDFFFDNKFYYFIIFLTKIRTIIYNLVLPHYYGKLISNLKKNNIDVIKSIFIYLICFWLFGQLLSIIGSYLEAHLTPKFLGYVRTKIIKKLIFNFRNNYKDIEIGRFITKIINTPYLLQDTLYKLSRFVTDNLLKVVSTFGYLFYYNKFIGICFIICMILICVITFIYYNSCSYLVYKSEKKYDDLHEYIEDTISNLLSIYSSNKNKEELEKYKKENSINEKYETDLEICNLKYRMVYCVLYILFFIVINYFTIELYMQKSFKLSILISIIIINYGILSDLMYLFFNIGNIIDGYGRIKVFDEYMKILDNEEENNIKNNINKINNKLSKINLTHKTFQDDFVKYEIKDLYFKINNKFILKNINLSIKKNENVLLTGNIGSGKSTLCKLIFGLYKTKTGSIKFNDVDKNDLDEDVIKNYVTYIPQHPKLFNRTLYENLTYGIKNPDINKIYKILDELNLFELKKKYVEIMYNKTGKNGSNLSGGQRQIVWILRSILKNNKMIILDEPTSSLDISTKNKVMKLIKKLGENKNIIIISHDRDIHEYMDRHIEIKNGMIIKNEKLNH